MDKQREQWEYRLALMPITNADKMRDLNAFGKMGWELVGIYGDSFLLKRKIIK